MSEKPESRDSDSEIPFETLIEDLKNNDREIRWNAAIVLGNRGDARAVEPLINTFQDGRVPVNLYAADALVQIGEVAVSPLIHALKSEARTVRFFAAETLGRLGNQVAVEPLLKILKDPDEDVRYAAVEALGRLGDPQALPALKSVALADEGEALWGYVKIKEAARQAIKQIEDTGRL